MKGLLDTNLLIYASVESLPEHEVARKFLQASLTGPEIFATTWINVGEYLSFTTQAFAGNPPLLNLHEALENIAEIIFANEVSILSEGARHWNFLNDILKQAGSVRGAFVHDCRIAAIMLENGVNTIYTHDADFRKIPQLKVVDPLL